MYKKFTKASNGEKLWFLFYKNYIVVVTCIFVNIYFVSNDKWGLTTFSILLTLAIFAAVSVIEIYYQDIEKKYEGKWKNRVNILPSKLRVYLENKDIPTEEFDKSVKSEIISRAGTALLRAEIRGTRIYTSFRGDFPFPFSLLQRYYHMSILHTALLRNGYTNA